jgi:menaquinol-cytochrome c reductase iron-sulfur subunit
MQSQGEHPAARRRFLGGLITAIQTAIVGTLGVILGGAIISPGLGRQQENWLPAASLGDLPPNEPTPVTIRVARQDGYTQVVDRRTVFLVKTGDGQVTALDSTCTHLGCRVSWNAEAQQLKCPCHGGVYDRTGMVLSGPPPMALARIATRVDGDQVLVQV